MAAALGLTLHSLYNLINVTVAVLLPWNRLTDGQDTSDVCVCLFVCATWVPLERVTQQNWTASGELLSESVFCDRVEILDVFVFPNETNYLLKLNEIVGWCVLYIQAPFNIFLLNKSKKKITIFFFYEIQRKSVSRGHPQFCDIFAVLFKWVWIISQQSPHEFC